ncbi:MAG: glutathione S-transferase family protein [Gammaproteobacteria bacterium]|nr:glutathione S-transferase family protein [Gammaproteobacteria bacterium]
MKLYYFPISAYSQKALMAFYEKEVEFEPQLVNMFDDGERTKYREIYPLGKVPCMFLDDGWMIPESSIIIEYLDTHFDSGPRLIPEDKNTGRQVRFLDRISDLYLNDAVVSLLFQSWKPEAERDTALIERSAFRANVMYDYFEHLLAEREWLGGEFSMADCAAAPALLYAQQSHPFTKHKNISAYWERLSNRPSWQKVMQEAGPHLEELQAANG